MSKEIGPYLRAFYESAKPGCCPGCDFPILRRKGGGGRKQKICGLSECWRLYHLASRMDRKIREAARKFSPPPPKVQPTTTKPIGAAG